MKNKLHILFAMLLVCVGFASCTDDDTFSSSPSNTLTLEVDTLSMDTVFSTVPTPHKMFWVRNFSGDGLRIANARLASGNQSGFRVNVNGSYLSPEMGYQVSDMELRKGDSLRVFVELTSRLQKDTLPRLVSDDLIFTLESGVQQTVNLRAWSWDAYMLRNLLVNSDTTIANDHGMPVVVYGNLTVDTLATLTIAPGTTMYFHNDAGIKVNGTLIAKGEKDNEITLRSDRLDRMVSNLMYDNNPGQWGGIRFAGCSFGNEIEYLDMHAGTTALRCDSSEDATRQKLTIRNTTIHNMSAYGIYAGNSKITMENTQVSNAFSGCLSFLGGDIDINQCTIVQYYPFDAMRGAAIRFAYANDTVPRPLAMRVRNSIVKGYADDVIMWSYGGIPSDTAMNVRFDNCLLRTVMPTDKDAVMFENSIIEDAANPLTQGVFSFKRFDTDFFYYDFTPLPGTLPIGNANPETALPFDRYGRERSKEHPDMGCFETEKEEKTEE